MGLSFAVLTCLLLHCPLAESVLNFGPTYSFWCFSYERYNGILGSYSTNNHSINAQDMRNVLYQSLEIHVYVLDCDIISDEYKERIMSNLDSHFSNASTGSLKLQQLDYNVYKVLSALTPPRNSFVLLNNFLSTLFTSRTPLLSNQHNIYLPTFSGFKYYLNSTKNT